jgi:hypothetical protein
MPDTERRSPIYNIAGLAIAGLIVIAAAVLVVVIAPTLKKATPLDRLLVALNAQLPGSVPQVTGPDEGGALRIALKVPFDPTADWKQTQQTFERASVVAEASGLHGVKTLEIALAGVSVEGHPASMTRTLNYEAAKTQ